MRNLLLTVFTLALCHTVLGVLSFCLGMGASLKAGEWPSHTVSPLWSGVFFTLTGILGFACAKKRSAYMIMCFTAFSIVSLVTSVVSLQLLRLGLVKKPSKAEAQIKESVDRILIGAMVLASLEAVTCIVSSFVSCRLARRAKREMERKRSQMYHTQDSESENNNKCAVYSVEKGYHNPYIESHPFEIQEEIMYGQKEEVVQENQIQILVNDVENSESVCTRNVIADDIADTTADVNDEIAAINSTAENSNPYKAGVRYHWKNKAKLPKLNIQAAKDPPEPTNGKKNRHSLKDKQRFSPIVEEKLDGSKSESIDGEENGDNKGNKGTDMEMVQDTAEVNSEQLEDTSDDKHFKVLQDLEITTP